MKKLLKQTKELENGCEKVFKIKNKKYICGYSRGGRIYCPDCKQKAKEILEKIGCGKNFGTFYNPAWCLGPYKKCPTCQEIKEICERILK
jgi:hypothetical protein